MFSWTKKAVVLSAVTHFFKFIVLKNFAAPRHLLRLPVAKPATGCQVSKLYPAAVMCIENLPSFLPLRIGLKNPAMGLREPCKFPNWIRRGAPTAKPFSVHFEPRKRVCRQRFRFFSSKHIGDFWLDYTPAPTTQVFFPPIATIFTIFHALQIRLSGELKINKICKS